MDLRIESYMCLHIIIVTLMLIVEVYKTGLMRRKLSKKN